MDQIGWEFPSTNGGKEDGLNDSGISYFQANPIKSLTREVIQDSLDARVSVEKPAIVKFVNKHLYKQEIPGIDGLNKIFELATKSYEGVSNETYDFFKKGYKALQKETISVLAIRDYNTTGLTKVGKTKNSHFHRLTKTTGDTAKTGTSNGSYGIGKHAPFAASIFRTMLYATLNSESENNKGFQGVIKIASFDRGEEYPTQGTGFYGIKGGFRPLTDLSGLHPFFTRESGDYGTDKFILGFEGNNNWMNTVIEETVSNYMWAIINGSLEVLVEKTIINKETLEKVVEQIKEFNPKSSCLEFYLTLTSQEATIKLFDYPTEDGQIETMKLFLLSGGDFNNRVSFIRGTGMKIYEKGHFRTPITFAGSLIVEGKNLNEVVRKMEPPTHDDWEPGLYKKNPKYAKDLKKSLYKWLNEKVREITPKVEQDSLEIPGLANILPSLNQEEEPTQEIDTNFNDEKIESIVIVTNSMIKRERKQRPKLLREPRPTRPPNPKPEPKDKTTKAKISTLRAFCLDGEQGQYRLVINPVRSGEALIEVNLVGESVTENAKIYGAILDQTGEYIGVNGNVLGPVNLSSDVKTTITLTLDNVTRYSLEVVSI
ncbi:hypothetical protein [Neobacillus sp. PS2-9]|uniref:hypothetical protein n=1 Tax=Neobacillus sp. PS2-9 TaxID=3070676 RepID=UPI0027E09F7E|nr:hypothetical protein [Neobacillus sp. PS2-9]WML57756.1 hypothetical protein RCG25_23105 [Neobacillus sp. PS2-9]